MELILQNNLEHQQQPVDAISEVLEGATWQKSNDVHANPTLMTDDTAGLKQSIIDVKKRLLPDYPLDFAEPDEGGPLNLDIKMETGTGKTYVYTKTIYELHQRFGLNKFVVFVPSLAIKAGTEQFMGDLYVQRHFKDACGYQADLELGVLEALKPKKGKRYFPSVVEDYVTGSNQQKKKIYVLLMNMALLTAPMMKRDDYDFGVLGFYRPLNAIKATKPVVIIDEPHRFTRKQAAYSSILEELKPQLIIRYGATFPEYTIGRGKLKETKKDYLNLLYDLNAYQSFRQNLIKGVAKEHFDLDEGQQERIKVVEINDKEKTVTLRYGTKTETLQAGDPITLAPQEMQGISIESVEKGKITLSNTREYHVSEQFCPSIYGDSYQENMIRRALHWHFETERTNFEQERKIKTLALFFIDSIRSYRGPNGTNGWLADRFEQILKEMVEAELRSKCSAAYRSYLEATLKDLYHCHAGYFAEDQQSSDDEVASQVKLILHDKKQLLGFRHEDGSWNTCRFIFSKWTLREGWDNPNVFTICKLRSSGSENSKLQEVGRGLRLPVDEYGNRSSEEFTLNYIVDYDDKDFAEKLVDEINGGRKNKLAITDKIPTELIIAVAKKRGITEKKLVMDLMANDMVDFNGLVNKSNLHKLYELYPEFADTGLGNKIINRNKKDKKNIKIRKEQFEELRDLWMKINRRYVLYLEPVIEHNLEQALPSLLKDDVFMTEVIASKRERVVAGEAGQMTVISGTGGQYEVHGNRLPYGEFLQRINRATSVPIRMLHKAMCQVFPHAGALNQELINDQSAIRLINKIKDWKMENTMKQFSYKQVTDNVEVKRTRLTDEDGEPYHDIAQAYIGDHIDNSEVAPRYLYDTYTYDSDLELENLVHSDIHDVVVFGKIPRRSISIPTITKESYSPDFMYIVNKKDGSKELKLILETKGVDMKGQLKEVEIKKISCAKKFFEQLCKDCDGLTVNFEDQLNNKKLLSIISELTKKR